MRRFTKTWIVAFAVVGVLVFLGTLDARLALAQAKPALVSVTNTPLPVIPTLSTREAVTLQFNMGPESSTASFTLNLDRPGVIESVNITNVMLGASGTYNEIRIQTDAPNSNATLSGANVPGVSNVINQAVKQWIIDLPAEIKGMQVGSLGIPAQTYVTVIFNTPFTTPGGSMGWITLVLSY